MKFSRRVTCCTRLDKIKYEDIQEGLNSYSVKGRIGDYREKRLTFLNRMDKATLPGLALHYAPKGHGDTGRPFKSWI
jgi:hypothetical protein